MIDKHAAGLFNRHKLDEPARWAAPDREDLPFVGSSSMDEAEEVFPRETNLFLAQPMLESMLVNNHFGHAAHTLLYDKII